MNNFGKLPFEETYVQYQDRSFSSLHEVLNPGLYKLKSLGGGLFGPTILGFQVNKPDEKLIKFQDGIVKHTIKLVSNFLKEDTITKYKSMGLLHRMGIILHGPPGTGKTCTAKLIMQELVDNNSAVCIDYTGFTLDAIKQAIQILRKVQNNPIALFYDEIDNSFNNNEHGYLTFLDGEKGYDNLILIGCTNKLGKIPNRIINRKSRIKHCIEIKSFPRPVYEHYIKEKLPELDAESTAKISYLAEENCLTIDQLKHALIDHYIDGISIEESITEVKKVIIGEKEEGY